MLGTDLGHRQWLAPLAGLCLILALTVVPAAGAIPILVEGDEDVPALGPSSGSFTPAPLVRTSSTGVDWTTVVLVAVVVLSAVVAATTLIVTARRRRPVPAARF